ncbi:hypothetical protein Tco_0701669 [Tanacetum coccineum]
MESSISNSEEGELQQMQLEESELHQKCLAWFKNLKIHLGNLHRFSEVINIQLFEIAFQIFFREEHQTFIDNMYHNLNQLQWQLERHNFHGHDSKTCFEVLRTPLILLRYLEELDKLIDERVLKYGELRMKEREVQAKKEIEKWLIEKEIQQQGSLVTEGITLDATLVTEGISLDASLVTEAITLDASLVIEGISLDAGLVVKQSTVDSVSSTSSEQLNECNSSRNECNSLRNECIISWNENRSSDNESSNSGNYANVNIVPSYESDTMSKAMLKFEKEIVSKQNPSRENVFINSSFEDNVKRIARNRLSEEFEPLVKDVNLQLNCFEKGLVKEMKDDLKYVMSLEDEL